MGPRTVGQKLLWSIGIPGLLVAVLGVAYFWLQASRGLARTRDDKAAAVAELVAQSFRLTDAGMKGKAGPIQGAHRAVTEVIRSDWKLLDYVVALRVIDRHGVVRWSRQAEEEGKRLPDAARWLAAAQSQAKGDIPAASPERIRPLGEMSCAGCHPSDAAMKLGVLQFTVDEPKLRREVNALFLGALGSLLLFAGVVAIAAAVAFRTLITQPLAKLARAMRRAEEGDYVARADGRGRDELAQLGRAFNQLLAKLTELRASEIDTQRHLVLAQEQLSLREALERSNAQLNHRINELSLLYDLARSFTSSVQLPELLDRITQLIAERMRLPQLSIMLLGPENTLQVQSAYPAHRRGGRQSFRVGEGACGRAAQTLQAVYLPDVEANDSIFAPNAVRPQRGSLLCVPIIHQDTLLGVLNFRRPDKAAFPREEIELLTAVADQAAVAVKNALLHAETVALSLTDPLTGAPNRRHLATQLEMEIARANRFGTQLSILMIDIDHFKLLNDHAGHRAGDVILRQVYELMKGMTRKVDTLARYGGEEFLVLLPQVTKDEAVEVAEKLRRAVHEHPFPFGSQPDGKISISVGVANLPVDAGTTEEVVDSADAALYASKRAGRNHVTAYAAGMEQHPGRERGIQHARKIATAK